MNVDSLDIIFFQKNMFFHILYKHIFYSQRACTLDEILMLYTAGDVIFHFFLKYLYESVPIHKISDEKMGHTTEYVRACNIKLFATSFANIFKLYRTFGKCSFLCYSTAMSLGASVNVTKNRK